MGGFASAGILRTILGDRGRQVEIKKLGDAGMGGGGTIQGWPGFYSFVPGFCSMVKICVIGSNFGVASLK